MNSRIGIMTGLESERAEFDYSNRAMVVGELEKPLTFT